MKSVLLTVMLLVAVGAAAQTNYYVSTSGSDANDGSAARPWATIGRASSALVLGAGGAVVNVAPGSYGAVSTARSGSASQPIVYKSTTKYGARIASSGGSVWANTGAYVTIQDFEVTGSGNNCIGIITYSGNTQIVGNWVHDIPAPTSTCGDGTGGAAIDSYSSSNSMSSGNINTKIIGNIVDNVGSGATQGCNNQHGIYVASPLALVQNNIVSRVCGMGIHIYHYTTNEVVTNNVVINNSEGGIQNTADGGVVCNDHSTVSNNIVANNGGLRGALSVGGITELSGCTGSGNVYRNNILYGNSPNAIQYPHGARTESGTIVPSAAQFNALFVNYTGNAKTGDYRLNPASVAVDAGLSNVCASGGITPCIAPTDFLGSVRPQSGTLDIGAFETGAVAASAPNPPTGLTATVQ